MVIRQTNGQVHASMYMKGIFQVHKIRFNFALFSLPCMDLLSTIIKRDGHGSISLFLSSQLYDQLNVLHYCVISGKVIDIFVVQW